MLRRRLAFFALGLSPAFFGGCGAKTGLPLPEMAETIKVNIGTLRPVDKVDLLLVIDNSISMRDKQSELGRRMPQLVKALTNTDPDPKTGKPKYRPVLDLHVGVITSSLGSHGTSACVPKTGELHNDDHGHLLPRAGEGGGKGWMVKTEGGEPIAVDCPEPVTASALSWVFDPVAEPKAMFKGPEQNQTMQAGISCVVRSAGDDGCGFEETWEAMYHFLVDPAPYLTAKASCTLSRAGDSCSGSIVVSGLDSDILAQRKAFLRPDSVLAVVVLSDENDVSLRPSGRNWLPYALGSSRMPRGFAACASVPDDFEPDTPEEIATLHGKYGCWSCAEKSGDANCSLPWPTDRLNTDLDSGNLRGFHQVQRFGTNFLWSRQRYVDAFTSPTVLGSDGKRAPNPVFAGGLRTGDLVIVAGIVGVPHGLVTNADGTPKNLGEADWAKIAGPLELRDPHMIESVAPRTDRGLPKFAGDRSVDPVHGGERDIQNGFDLQYACIAKRATTEKSWDCELTTPAKSPLCGPANTQPYFKAYPGLRHLRILRALGPLGYVASICSDDYSVAVRGIIERVQLAVDGQCLRTKLLPDTTGALPCQLFETFASTSIDGKMRCEELGSGYCTPGAAPCRMAGSVAPPIDTYSASKMFLSLSVVGKDGVAREESVPGVEETGNVYATGSDGRKRLVCEVMQLAGGRVSPEETTRCANEESFTPSTGGGWCFTQNATLVTNLCTRYGSTGKLRFFGATTPRAGSELFALCR